MAHVVWLALPLILGACDGAAGSSLGGDSGAAGVVDGGGPPDQGAVVVPPGGTELQLEISSPARGATLDGDTAVNVQGRASGTVRSLTVNGAAVTPAADGTFAHTVQAVHGMNLLIVEAENEKGVKEKLVQSFYHSSSWHQTSPAEPASGLIADAMVGWLGQPVFDDNDPATFDFASALEAKLAALDVASLVPSSQRLNGVLGCKYVDIKIKSVQVNPGKVSIDTTAEGLVVKVLFTGLQARVEADLNGAWYNPACLIGVNGKVMASSIEVTAKVDAWVDGGQLKAQAKQTTAKVNGFDIKISGIWGFLTNWLVNRFEGDLARDLEKQLKAELDNQVAPLLSKGMGDLSISERIEAPPLLGAGPNVAVDLVSRPGTLSIQATGVRFGIGGTAVSEPLVEYPSLGSIGHGGCAAKAFGFEEKAKHPLQVAVSDDLINQLFYSLHRGGLVQAKLTPQDVAELGSVGAGVKDLQGSLDALLPPILNTCTADGRALLQLGDLQLRLSFSMIGAPVEMQLHLSIEVPVKTELRKTAKGQRLGLTLEAPSRVEVESRDLSSGQSTVFDIVRGLLEKKLLPDLVASLTEQSVSVLVPEIDLHKLEPSIPAGTKVRLKVARVEQRAGYTVVVGDIE